jgi:putative redox protein
MPRFADVAVRWRDDLVFESEGDARQSILVDGNTAVAISPVELLLVAAATCTAADVVEILKKKRVDLTRVDVAVHGTRRDEQPRRYTAIHFAWTVAGAGADETKARHAIDLSVEKYCSVLASLAPDIAVTYDVTLA